ncbi:MAG: GNAT family N-acetyltransferase [Acidimicrobiia bacterium]
MIVPLEIREFEPSDQDAVRSLILDGLAERWGGLDPLLNRDLDDIATTYAEAAVLVARVADRIVGVGMLVPVAPRDGEIKRMAVARDRRRAGIGTELLRGLVAVAERNGWDAVRLETTATWTDAVRLYERFGFEVTHYEDGRFSRDVHFELNLSRQL